MSLLLQPYSLKHPLTLPPRIHHISTSGHLQVKKGSSVRIECSASGNPTPNVTWSRKNNILPNDPPEITVERPIVFSGEGHEAMLVCIVHGETQPESCYDN
uniref:Ig-like domain-containing protein n=1 Tax=Glossina brevipalpis TaxID=37001 RepID=A0A1A9WIF9_9MUSC